MKRPTEYLDENEVKLLLSLPDRRTLQGKRDFAILLILTTCGLRKAEVCSLKIIDIKPYRNTYALFITGKGKRHRKIFLNQTTIEALKVYKKGLNSAFSMNLPLFQTLGKHGPYKSKPLTPKAVDCIVKKYVQKACIKKRITPHSLRHSTLSNMLANGADLKTVQTIAGHSSIRTTEIYLHTQDEKMALAAWLLENAYDLESIKTKLKKRKLKEALLI